MARNDEKILTISQYLIFIGTIITNITVSLFLHDSLFLMFLLGYRLSNHSNFKFTQLTILVVRVSGVVDVILYWGFPGCLLSFPELVI